MKYYLPTLLAIATIAPAQTVLRQYSGAVAQENFAHAIRLPGDLDSDGVDDLLLSVANPGGTGEFRGEIRAYSGRTGSLLYARTGGATFAQLGGIIQTYGDDNGDGVPDFLAGSQDSATGSGVTEVCSGVDGSILRTVPAVPGVLALERGVVLGDVNQDNILDVLVANPTASLAGSCQILSGADGSVLRDAQGTTNGSRFGAAFDVLSDLNGDGIPEYAVGAPGATDALQGIPGSVTVFSGSDGTSLYEILGSTANQGLGLAVTGISDVNNDGVNDLIVSSCGPRSVGPGNLAACDGIIDILSGVDGTQISRVVGAAQESLVAKPTGNLGDYNDDGMIDFLSHSRVRGIEIRDGRTGALISHFDGSSINAVSFGGRIATGSDLDGDGFEDIVVNDSLDNVFTGRVTIFKRPVPSGGRLCKSELNSTGQPALLSVMSPSGFAANANDLTLQTTQLPVNSMGYFVVSSSTVILIAPGGSSGRLCIAGTRMGRYANFVLNSGATGTVTFSPNTSSIPISGGLESATTGSIYNFQYWYRDAGPQGATSNFSDARTIRFQ